jgi:hypothetical protein
MVQWLDAIHTATNFLLPDGHYTAEVQTALTVAIVTTSGS